MTKTLNHGLRRLAHMPGAEGDGTMQVAVGVDPATSETSILVRFGSMVMAMSIEGAEALAVELRDVAAVARRQSQEPVQ